MNIESYEDLVNQFILFKDFMIWFWDYYVLDKDVCLELGVFFLYVDDLLGFVFVVVLMVKYDVFCDEGEVYVDKMSVVGVLVMCKCFECQMYGFFMMYDVLLGVIKVLEYVGEQIDCYLVKVLSVDVVIVGVGFVGMYQLYKLCEKGLFMWVFEFGSGVGGMWYWNCYFGVCCDIESMVYFYLFFFELE